MDVNSIKGKGFPIRTKQVATTFGGHHTDICVTEFENTFFIVITQFESIGTLLQISHVNVKQSELPIFDIATLLGEDECELQVIGRLLAEKLESKKSILLGLAIKETSPDMVTSIVHFVTSYIKEQM